MISNTKFLFQSFLNCGLRVKHLKNYVTHTVQKEIDTCTDLNTNPPKIKKILTMDTVNDRLINMEYAVRGEVLLKAKQLVEELQKGVKKPFKEVILTNIGDAQAMGQCPITFLRQVAALTLYPTLLDDPRFPSDAKQRAHQILSDCLGYSLGSYTHSQGIEIIRKHIAEYIYKRDGGDREVDASDIFLSDGASSMIKVILSFFDKEIDGKRTGCLVSVPQYPLYSATITTLGLHKIDYYLDEDHNWGLNMKELKRALEEARPFCVPRVLVIINPGNPTGQVCSRKSLEDAVKFAYKEGLFILADEVYQDNVYDEDSEFHSVRKVMLELGMPYSKMELISFHSASKGFAGECGMRGGYAELFNVDKEVKDELIKTVSIALCSNAIGQVIMDGIICPPKDDDPSCDLYTKEKCCILLNFADKASKIVNWLNSIDGIKCNKVQGAMYAFPKINLPEKFVEEAQSKNRAPDRHFCFKLLKEKGICFVPGVGFGQKPGTYHFRTTLLPPIEKLEFMVKELKDFMKIINEKYSCK